MYELPPMWVGSCFSTGRNPEPEVIRFIQNWASRRGFDFNKMRKFGFDIPVTEEQKKYGLRSYEFWINVPNGTEQKADGVKIKFISKAKYAKLRIENPFDEPLAKIRAGWNMLSDWVSLNKSIKSNANETMADEDQYMLEEIVETKEGTFIDLYYPTE